MKPMNNNIDRKCLLFVIFFILCHILNAQIDTSDLEIRVENEMLRRFEDLLDEDGGNQEEIENLLLEESENRQFEGLANLNTLSPEIAFSLLKLTDYQYYNLLAYISNYGELVSIYELVSVEGFSFEDLEDTKTRFVSFAGKTQRYDLAILQSSRFFGKVLVLDIQFGRFAIIGSDDVEEPGYLEHVYNRSEEETEDLRDYLRELLS